MKAVRALVCSAGVAASLAALLGCDEKQEASPIYSVVVRAVDEEGEPLSGLEISTAGQALGRTSEAGTLEVKLRGREGSQVSFEPRCPEGSHAANEPATLRLRTLADGPAPEVDVACKRAKRIAALVVSARGFPDLPVLVHDREVARTDATGTAHVLLEGAPSTPMRVVLDTSSNPKVVPPSPHHDVQIGARDDIVVFAPELTQIKDPPKPKRRAKREKRPPPVVRPERLR